MERRREGDAEDSRMRIRDANLREAVTAHKTWPGDPLSRLLAELQRWRDAAREEEAPPRPRAPLVERGGSS